jgi:MFS family permease
VSANDTAQIGLVAGVASLATAIGGFLFSRLGKIRPGQLLPVAFGLQAVGMLLIWVLPGLPGVIAGAVIASFGAGLLLPSLVTWVVAATHFEDRGRVTGWWTASFFLGQFLTPILIGVLTGLTGSLTVAVGIVGIAAGIVAVLVALRLRRAARVPAVA